MNGFTESQASDASRSSSASDLVLTFEQAESMLPLVRHILDDLRASNGRLARLKMEKSLLDLRKTVLAWPQRARRYQLNEEIAREQAHVAHVKSELEHLGVTLFQVSAGLVGFPTIVNNRPAFFSWKNGEDSILYWHFSRNPIRRVIPDAWKQQGPVLVQPQEPHSARRSA